MNLDSDSIMNIIKSDNTKEFFAVEPLGDDIFMVNEYNFESGGEIIESASELNSCRAILHDLLDKQFISTRGEPANTSFRTILPLTYFDIWKVDIDGERSEENNNYWI